MITGIRLKLSDERYAYVASLQRCPELLPLLKRVDDLEAERFAKSAEAMLTMDTAGLVYPSMLDCLPTYEAVRELLRAALLKAGNTQEATEQIVLDFDCSKFRDLVAAILSGGGLLDFTVPSESGPAGRNIKSR